MTAIMSPEESDFIVDQSERDAERVHHFLSALGFKQIWNLPIIFLLNVAAALRLIHWEMQGFKIHLDAGIISGDEALDNALLSWTEEDSPAEPLMPKVLDLSLQHIAWEGRSLLGADFTIACDEDQMIDAIARFCVKNRHSVKD